LVAHLLDRDVEIGAELELDADLRRARERGRLDRAHASDGVELLLEYVGDVLFHALGIGALERRDHREHGQVHVRELIHAQALVAEHAEHDQGEHHHPGEDGPPDRDVGERHGIERGGSGAPATAGSVASVPIPWIALPSARRRSTTAPSTSRELPRTITCSPTATPSTTSASPSRITPSWTLRRSARFPSRTTNTTEPSERCSTACSGLIGPMSRTATPRSARANKPGRSLRSGFSTRAFTRSVRVAGSIRGETTWTVARNTSSGYGVTRTSTGRPIATRAESRSVRWNSTSIGSIATRSNSFSPSET